jgi:transcriptional regulator with XRE-family HTH domain
MANKLAFSTQLRQAVRACGMSQYRLAKETGIAQSVLSRFLNCGYGLSMASVDKLCEAIGAELKVSSKRK